MVSSRGHSTAQRHLLTILHLISSARRSFYAEPGNQQGHAESLEKGCDTTDAEAVPSKTHLCVVVEEEEKEISEVLNLPRGKATNSSPPYCSARLHEAEANRYPATPPEVESSPPRETTEEMEEETEQPKRAGYLHLLVEAARLLEPGFVEDEESERSIERDSRKRAAMEEETAEATASKRRRRRTSGHSRRTLHRWCGRRAAATWSSPRDTATRSSGRGRPRRGRVGDSCCPIRNSSLDFGTFGRMMLRYRRLRAFPHARRCLGQTPRAGRICIVQIDAGVRRL